MSNSELAQMVNKRGPKQENCGTPQVRLNLLQSVPLKGNSGVKLKVFCMFGLGFMSQFLITSFPYRFIQMKYCT